VTDLYKEYAPDKVNTVDALLKQHKGKEEELIKKIKAKYGSGGGGENKEAPKKRRINKTSYACCSTKRCCMAGKSISIL